MIIDFTIGTSWDMTMVGKSVVVIIQTVKRKFHHREGCILMYQMNFSTLCLERKDVQSSVP